MMTNFTAMNRGYRRPTPAPDVHKCALGSALVYISGSAGGLVDPERVAQDIGHFAQRGAAAQRLLHRREQVLRAPGGGCDIAQRGIDSGLVAAGPHRLHPLDLT